jgi:hypothetical protein
MVERSPAVQSQARELSADGAISDPPVGVEIACPGLMVCSGRLAREPMDSLGRAVPYLALFSETALALFVPVMAGALLGRWADQQIGTGQLVSLVGFLAGIVIGGLADWRIMARFLRRFNDQG